MPKRPVFVIPPGLEIEQVTNKTIIRFDGDIRVDDALGQRIAELHATGDITLNVAGVGGVIVAGGVLTVNAPVDAVSLHARQVVLGTADVKCRSITAAESIKIGAADLAVDAIIAPEIALDPKAHGRVTVFESHNERGATKIKGGFSLADYEDMFGGADAFLAERSLSRLGASAAPPTPTVAPPEQDEDEDIDDPLSLSFDDLEPLAETGDAPNRNDEQLRDALDRILACYEGSDLPPAIIELKSMIEGQDYDGLRTNVTDVWNGLLTFHQKRGIRPHHQVTHAFNLIHSLVAD